LERNVDAVTPIPPNVETRRKPNEEQLAHVLDSTLKVDRHLFLHFSGFAHLSNDAYVE
jgi:hypothetical protein